MVKKEERKREREFQGEKEEAVREENRREAHWRAVKRQYDMEEGLENRELELEDRELMWAKREVERRLRLEREFDDERRERMRMEEEREEKERMLGLQIEHEKQMMQMQAEACQNQMQVLGVMARLVCQFFGSASDGLGGALGVLPPQVLHNLQHPGGLGDNGKPDANSPSEFM